MTIDLGTAMAGVGLALVATATALRLFERSADADIPTPRGDGGVVWPPAPTPVSPELITLSGRYFVIRGLTNIVELKR